MNRVIEYYQRIAKEHEKVHGTGKVDTPYRPPRA
jgi:hypothetical protein